MISKSEEECLKKLRVEIENPRLKCYDCMRPKSSCMCKYVSPIDSRSRFIILMHPMEHRKEKNGTGLLAKLQLSNSELIVGINFSENRRVNEILEDIEAESFLLYPGEQSFNLSTQTKSRAQNFLGNRANIFILDGTWPCAKKMLKSSPNLQKLKRISFDNEVTSKFVIKQQPNSLCLSTIESIYIVLNLLKKSNLEECDTKFFLLPFEKMIAYQIKCTLDPNNKNHYSSKKDRKVKAGVMNKKNMYKKATQRNIIFEKMKGR